MKPKLFAKGVSTVVERRWMRKKFTSSFKNAVGGFISGVTVTALVSEPNSTPATWADRSKYYEPVATQALSNPHNVPLNYQV